MNIKKDKKKAGFRRPRLKTSLASEDFGCQTSADEA